MNIIIRKVRVLAAPEPPFVGTSIGIAVDDPGALTWGIGGLMLANGHEKAVIAWGDGTQDEILGNGSVTHTYARTGEYEVRISDDIASITCSSGAVTSDFYAVYAPMIRTFVTTGTLLSDIRANCFYGTVNLTSVRFDGVGLRSIQVRAFGRCASLAGRIDLPQVVRLVAISFVECPGITELHFSAANEAAIRALPGWESSGGKFGAENATVRFDL